MRLQEPHELPRDRGILSVRKSEFLQGDSCASAQQIVWITGSEETIENNAFHLFSRKLRRHGAADESPSFGKNRYVVGFRRI